MKRPYPANLLSAIQLNEICGTAMDYATLTADQHGRAGQSAGAAHRAGTALSWTSITAKASYHEGAGRPTPCHSRTAFGRLSAMRSRNAR